MGWLAPPGLFLATPSARHGETCVGLPAVRRANEARQHDAVMAGDRLDTKDEALLDPRELRLFSIRRRHRVGEPLGVSQHHGELAS